VLGAGVLTYVLSGGIDRALFVMFIVIAGTAGLVVLQSLLVPSEARSATTGIPLGMFEIGAERGFSSRHLMRAVSTLLVLVVLYIALALSLRGVPPYLSMAAYTVVLAVVYTAAELRGRVWARISPDSVRNEASTSSIAAASASASASVLRSARRAGGP